MSENEDLYILWTSDNPVTAEKMVFMYAINSLLKGWWKNVTLILWGASVEFTRDDDHIKYLIKKGQDAGLHVTACKACADQLEATETLEDLGIEVIYWGVPLTELLKSGAQLITV